MLAHAAKRAQAVVGPELPISQGPQLRTRRLAAPWRQVLLVQLVWRL
jgi:hypothetical protein